MDNRVEKSWVLYLGTYPPRECGIATFTKDLTSAVEKKCPENVKIKICAMNINSVNIYNYPKEVIYQIGDSNIQHYIDTAKEINKNKNIKLINIQHEFGIFGGEYGSYLIPFLEIVNKPVVVTFHSVLPKPNQRLKEVVMSIADKVSCIIVMTKKGEEILREEYNLNIDIEIIPHGIPVVPFKNSGKEKKKLGYGEKIVLTSFGLIGPGKGYENVIESLPEVVKTFPNLNYLILGETHPIVSKKEGEKYRNFLEEKIKKLGLQNNVKFYNKYMTLQEILRYLGATDIYISSSINPNQITSGTLVYAMGSGRVVISTPFLHAKDAVTKERGLLTKFNDSQSFTESILKILSNPEMKARMEHNSYLFTRNHTWPNIAIAYLNLFTKHIEMEESYELPTFKLSHLTKLTDNFGVIQFANHATPDPSSGYTLDDNARALIVCAMHYDKFKEKEKLKLIRTYLNFIEYVQQPGGRLYNLVNYGKQPNLENWSDDAHGRGIWALGHLISISSIPEELKEQAEKILLKATKFSNEIKSPRAVAFMINGLYHYNLYKKKSENVHLIEKLADHLTSLYNDNCCENWQWFEESLAYSNSKLPESMYFAYLTTRKLRYLQVAEASLDFLNSITFEKGMFNPIGQNGWYIKNSKKAYFDQQPVDTASMVQTLMLAHQITKKRRYKNQAITAFKWFLGKNLLKQTVYDEETGGCHDGVGEFSINLNKGAESTISYLIARLAIEDAIPESDYRFIKNLKQEMVTVEVNKNIFRRSLHIPAKRNSDKNVKDIPSI